MVYFNLNSKLSVKIQSISSKHIGCCIHALDKDQALPELVLIYGFLYMVRKAMSQICCFTLALLHNLHLPASFSFMLHRRLDTAHPFIFLVAVFVFTKPVARARVGEPSVVFWIEHARRDHISAAFSLSSHVLGPVSVGAVVVLREQLVFRLLSYRWGK